MNIKRFNTGGFMTHTYLVWGEDKVAYLFDCEGLGTQKIEAFVQENLLDLKYIVLTHGHSDHICGLNKLKELYPEAKVFIGDEDEEFLRSVELNHSDYMFGINFIYQGAFTRIKEGDMIGKFRTMDTPGHTRGSKCFYEEESGILISGDTMFRRSFGRYDFPGSSGEQLFNSLRKLCRLPEATNVYSGHTESTTIGEEKIFLKSLRIL